MPIKQIRNNKRNTIMGMSASQARLLYLTAQLNNLTLRGQMVSDAKLRLALDTQQIQDKYIK